MTRSCKFVKQCKNDDLTPTFTKFFVIYQAYQFKAEVANSTLNIESRNAKLKPITSKIREELIFVLSEVKKKSWIN